MSKIPVLTAVRIIPRETDFLDRKSGSRGEIYYDRDVNTLRLYDGTNQGGTSLVKTDLTNVSNAVFAAKATAAGVGGGGGGGNTTVSVGATVPSSPSNGNLWLNTNNGSLYVYINDGDSNQWIQPAFSTTDLTDYATKTYVDSSVSAINATIASLPQSQLEFYVAADDSTQRRINNGNLIQFIGTNGITTASDADGNITVSTTLTTGNVTFSTTTIDTTDSSAITFTPAVSFQSDISVENDLKTNRINSINGIDPITFLPIINFKDNAVFDSNITVGNELFVKTVDTVDSSAVTFIPAVSFSSDITVENDIFVNNNLFATASIDTPRIKSSLSSGVILEGLTTLYKTTEVITNISGATGTVVHDFQTSSLFFHSNVAANFTANFTNIPTTEDRSISIALILDQGATAYIPNAVQIGGASQTIKWSGGSEPSGTNNYVDIVNFTLIRSGGAWTVLGSLSTYN